MVQVRTMEKPRACGADITRRPRLGQRVFEDDARQVTFAGFKHFSNQPILLGAGQAMNAEIEHSRCLTSVGFRALSNGFGDDVVERSRCPNKNGVISGGIGAVNFEFWAEHDHMRHRRHGAQIERGSCRNHREDQAEQSQQPDMR